MPVYEGNGKRFTIPDGMTLQELPVVSISTNVTTYFGINLESAVIVKPESTITFYVEVPLDLGVFVTDGKRYRQIDLKERFSKKYSLYGSVENGIVYRYWVSRVSDSPFFSEDRALTKVVVKNEADTIGDLKIVLFDVRYFSLFKDEDKVIGEEIRLERLKKGLAIVKPTNNPSIPGAKVMDYTPLNPFTRGIEMGEGT